MVEQPFERAEPGDELARQQGISQGYVSISEEFQRQLEEARKQQQLGIGRSQLIQESAPQVEANIGAVRDLSSLAPGRAPSEALTAASSLGAAFTNAAAETAQQASNQGVLAALSGLLQAQQAREDYQTKRLQTIQETGIDPDTGKLVENENLFVTPDGRSFDEEQKKNLSLKGQAAILEIKRQGGDKLLSTVNKSDQAKLAEEILKNGGVQEFTRSANLLTLLTEEEIEARRAQQGIVSAIDEGIGLLEGQGAVSGIGPIAGTFANITGGIFVDNKGAALRSAITEVGAEKLRETSGKVISDKERNFLINGGYLPSVKDDERIILEKLKRLKQRYAINDQIFEYAKRNNMDINQAYEEIGADVFESEGLEVPKDLLTSRKSERVETTGRDQVIQTLKQNGVSEEEIEAYLKAKGL